MSSGPQIHHAPFTQLTSLVAELGAKRVFVVTGPSGRHRELLSRTLTGRDVLLFSEAVRHVPASLVERASKALEEFAPDLLLSVGGGSCTGLAKALRLSHDLPFIAAPTTFSGSELTNLYGITDAGRKRTGRDDKVRPDHVLYAPELVADLPQPLAVASLLNALAHPISVLEGLADGEPQRDEALRAAARVLEALEHLLGSPGESARALALGAAGVAARCLQLGSVGVQHRMAHELGGSFDLEHSALHAVLLPHTVSWLRQTRPRLIAELERLSGIDDLEAYLFDASTRANVASSLRSLGVAPQELRRWLDAGPLHGRDPEQTLLRAACLGRRPSRHARRLDFGLAEPVTVRGAELGAARRVVLALHGRGSSADAVAERVVEILGGAGDVCVVAPQAPEASWYPKRHTESRASHGPELAHALAECLRAVETLGHDSQAPVVLFGFSQGACLAFELLAKLPRRFAAVVALSGSAIGGLDEPLEVPSELGGLPVLMGASERDPWLNEAELQHTAQLLRDNGAQVHCEIIAGQEHLLHARHRSLAQPLLRGVDAQAFTH